METKIIRDFKIIKNIVSTFNIEYTNIFIILKFNHPQKTASCIIDFSTLKKIKLDYNTIIALL